MASIPHATIPTLKLNDGTSIPMLGYGTGTAWMKKPSSSGILGSISSSLFRDIDRTTVEAVKSAIKMGYTHLDNAETYNTEAEMGVAIKESKVDRSKLFVTTKVLESIADIHGAIDRSLQNLQLEYVDLYLIHSPLFAKTEEDLQKAWKTMEEVKDSGKAKSIGVSNYLEKHLKATLATASIPPSINQIEFHPYLQHEYLVAYHQAQNIALSAYGPLTAVTRAKPGPCDKLLASLANKYYVSEGEIALRWCLDQGVVAITTSGKEERLSDYLRAMAFKLTPREVKELSELGLQKHYRGFWKAKFDENDRS